MAETLKDTGLQLMTWNWIFKSPLLRLRIFFCPFQKTRFYPSWRPIIPWHILWDMSPQPFNLSSCDGEVSKNSPASHTPLPEYETLCRIADSLLSFIQSKVFISILYFFYTFFLLSQMFPFDNRSQLQPSTLSPLLPFTFL